MTALLLLQAAILKWPLLSSGGAQSAMNPAGPQAGRIQSLTALLVYVNGAVFLAVLLFTGLALYRAAKNKDGRPAEIPGQKRAAIWVGASVAVTTVILGIFLVQSVARGRAISTLPPKSALEIDVIGHQWWWEFQYANPSAEMRIVTANEIHIPVGRPVRIVTDSRDVIHSFWVPNLHGKLDMIPNHQNVTWIEASKAGQYRGQCAEYCGLQHAHMGFLVVAEPEADFDRWTAQQRSEANPPKTLAEQTGQQIFLSASCVICHRVRGTAAMGFAAPDLTHFGSRHYLAAGTAPNTLGYLAGWITDTQHMKPGNRMPPIDLEPRDMQPLLAYLESLK